MSSLKNILQQIQLYLGEMLLADFGYMGNVTWKSHFHFSSLLTFADAGSLNSSVICGAVARTCVPPSPPWLWLAILVGGALVWQLFSRAWSLSWLWLSPQECGTCEQLLPVWSTRCPPYNLWVQTTFCWH